jgi:hypothetical protein
MLGPTVIHMSQLCCYFVIYIYVQVQRFLMPHDRNTNWLKIWGGTRAENCHGGDVTVNCYNINNNMIID